MVREPARLRVVLSRWEKQNHRRRTGAAIYTRPAFLKPVSQLEYLRSHDSVNYPTG